MNKYKVKFSVEVPSGTEGVMDVIQKVETIEAVDPGEAWTKTREKWGQSCLVKGIESVG